MNIQNISFREFNPRNFIINIWLLKYFKPYLGAISYFPIFAPHKMAS
jgi:hypothetical protein